MLSLRIPIVAITLATYALAQNPAAELQTIEAHFTGSRIVPEMLDSFEPTALLHVNYEGIGEITPGQKFAKEQVGPEPTLTLVAGSTSEKFEGNYTLIMADANWVGYTDPQVTRHWLVNGATVVDNKVTIGENAVVITKYAGPWPAAGSGSHRYSFLLYAQPETFVPLAEFTPDMPVGTFALKTYVQDTQLGALIAGNYINVEEGTATASIPATSPVASGSAPSGSSGVSATGKPSGSSPSGSAPAPTGSDAPGNGAMTNVASGFLAIGAAVAGYLLL
jgi:hypothetical protein